MAEALPAPLKLSYLAKWNGQILDDAFRLTPEEGKLISQLFRRRTNRKYIVDIFPHLESFFLGHMI